MSRELILIVVVIAFGWATWTVKPGRPGLVPWYTTESLREDNERMWRNRRGPDICPRWEAKPMWRKVIQRTHSWCGPWLDEQERLARLGL